MTKIKALALAAALGFSAVSTSANAWWFPFFGDGYGNGNINFSFNVSAGGNGYGHPGWGYYDPYYGPHGYDSYIDRYDFDRERSTWAQYGDDRYEDRFAPERHAEEVADDIRI